MSETTTSGRPAPEEDWTPAGFVRLARRGPDARSQAGCILVLAVLLLAVGGGAITVFFVNPAGKGDPLVLLAVGGLFALVGAVLLFGGVRGMRGSSAPVCEVFVEGSHVLAAGGEARLRLRQPGPIRIESLKVTLLCEREYERRVRPRSPGTVVDHQRLVEQVLTEVRDKRIGRGESLELEVCFTVPSEGPPTGPAQPDGTIRWTLEVLGEAGVLRATHHPYEITVTGPSPL